MANTVVIDGFDNTEARRIVTDHCKSQGIPCLHAGLFEEYAEVVWNDSYTVPQEDPAGDVCDYPLARNLILVAVAMATEEIINFCLGKSRFATETPIDRLQSPVNISPCIQFPQRL